MKAVSHSADSPGMAEDEASGGGKEARPRVSEAALQEELPQCHAADETSPPLEMEN